MRGKEGLRAARRTGGCGTSEHAMRCASTSAPAAPLPRLLCPMSACTVGVAAAAACQRCCDGDSWVANDGRKRRRPVKKKKKRCPERFLLSIISQDARVAPSSPGRALRVRACLGFCPISGFISCHDVRFDLAEIKWRAIFRLRGLPVRPQQPWRRTRERASPARHSARAAPRRGGPTPASSPRPGEGERVGQGVGERRSPRARDAAQRRAHGGSLARTRGEREGEKVWLARR